MQKDPVCGMLVDENEAAGRHPTKARRERGSKQDLNAANTRDKGARVKAPQKHIAVLLTALALVLAGGRAGAEPPKRLGNLPLLHASQGKEALQEINRLHGKEVGAKDGYVAHYEKDGAAAMLYLAQASSTAQAARQLKQMSDLIQRGGSPFYHLKTSRQGETTLYSALGQGQIHYFYQRDSSVVWLAVDAPVAKQTLADLLEWPKAAKE